MDDNVNDAKALNHKGLSHRMRRIVYKEYCISFCKFLKPLEPYLNPLSLNEKFIFILLFLNDRT